MDYTDLLQSFPGANNENKKSSTRIINNVPENDSVTGNVFTDLEQD
ncbi:hypothetical protein [Aquimarina algiphila]|nr:hypothetical protein [Aquimarina algiphila]